MRREPVKSAARTFEVLDLFSEQRRPLRLSYIVEKLSYPQSSTTTLLKTMSMLGFLNYDRRSRTYFPTPRVAGLGDWVNHYVYGKADIDDVVEFVFEKTDESVAVSSQNDIFIQHIRIMQPSHGHIIPIREGSMRVLTHSAPGLVLMSGMDRMTVDKLCRHINAYIQDRTVAADIPLVQEQLEWIRKAGYGLLTAFPFTEASAIAVPLPRTAHGIPLTLGVGGLNSRIARHRLHILGVLKDAVKRYEEKLLSAPEEKDD